MRLRGWLSLVVLGGIVVASAAAANGCGSDVAEGSAGDAGGGSSSGSSGSLLPVDALAIDPPEATLVVTGGPAPKQKFRAMGQVAGGAPFEVPADFSVDLPAPGSVDKSGLYTASNTTGGLVTLTGAYNGKSATAKIKVVLDVSESAGNVPPNVADLFDPGKNQVVENDPGSPSLVYPVKDTMFPQNLGRLMFNWRAQGAGVFLLEFAGPGGKVKIFTDGVHAVCTKAGTNGSCWETAASSWGWLAASNPGAEVRLVVKRADPAAPGKVFASKPYTFRFSKKPVPGAIYYWSTTQKGIRRGAMADAQPTNFLTPPEADGNCAACHTLSRNGKRMAADVGGEKLWVVEVSKTAPPPRVFTKNGTADIESAWATFSPDTTRIVSAKKGVLTLRDGNTGAPIGGPLALGASKFGTMPDWAPDGKHLVYSTNPSKADDRAPPASSLAWLSVAGDVLSTPEILVASTGAKDTMGHPMFNPTSAFVSFTRGEKIKDDPTAQIWVAKATPGGAAVQLVRADTLVNDGEVLTGVQNSMATWAPAGEPELQWIAFTSTRDWGTILANGSTYGSKRDQLWIAAIDATKLGGGGDPSFPAFRVPFQELSEDAHRPFWAEDAINPPPPPPPDDGGTCLSSGQECASGTCCSGLICEPDNGGTYACVPRIN